MILVTGATGHVGRAVVCRLASLGHDVAMVRDVQAASRRLPSGIALRVTDYEDASALKRALAGIDDLVLIFE
jgi:NAD(P)H dehydrogenase (quinone)